MKIGIVGTGYVGLVAAACFADAGHEVICIDSDPEKLAKLKHGTPPFFEPGLGDLLQKNFERLYFSDAVEAACQGASLIFIAVGTPEREDGSADMGPTYLAVEQICKSAQGPKTVVLKSTVPIGTAKEIQDFCRSHSKYPIEIVNNPEFLKQGAAVEDFLHPDRIVVGCQSAQARELMSEVYRPFIEAGHALIFMDNTSAEMTKYAANSFLAMKISFINELANLADKLGADIDRVREGFTSDSRINPAFFSPGIGYGGSCFPKDVRALIHTSEQVGLNPLLLQATDEVNERQKRILADRLANRFNSIEGKKIAIWGLSFKPNTDDVRRAPSIPLIESLVEKGARVSAYDPVAGNNAKKACQVEFELARTAMEAVEGADALVIVTEWNEFKAANFEELKARLKTPFVLDGRNLYDPVKMTSLGFEYWGIGKKVQAVLGRGSRTAMTELQPSIN